MGIQFLEIASSLSFVNLTSKVKKAVGFMPPQSEEDLSPTDRLRRGCQDVQAGRVYSIDKLWDMVDAD